MLDNVYYSQWDFKNHRDCGNPGRSSFHGNWYGRGSFNYWNLKHLYSLLICDIVTLTHVANSIKFYYVPLMGATIDKTVSGITPRARGNPGRHHFFLFNVSSHWKMVCNLNPQNRTCLVLYVDIVNFANHHIIFLLRGLWKKVSEITPLSHPTYSLAKYIVFVIWNKALLTFINVFKL